LRNISYLQFSLGFLIGGGPKSLDILSQILSGTMTLEQAYENAKSEAHKKQIEEEKKKEEEKKRQEEERKKKEEEEKKKKEEEESKNN